MATFIASAVIFLGAALALSLGVIFQRKSMQGTSCQRRRRVMGEDGPGEGTCCGAHETCCHGADRKDP